MTQLLTPILFFLFSFPLFLSCISNLLIYTNHIDFLKLFNYLILFLNFLFLSSLVLILFRFLLSCSLYLLLFLNYLLSLINNLLACSITLKFVFHNPLKYELFHLIGFLFSIEGQLLFLIQLHIYFYSLILFHQIMGFLCHLLRSFTHCMPFEGFNAIHNTYLSTIKFIFIVISSHLK